MYIKILLEIKISPADRLGRFSTYLCYWRSLQFVFTS